MDATKLNAQYIELLSRITQRNLRQEELTPPVVFLTALIPLVLGIIYVDNNVTESENQQLQKMLNQLAPLGSEMRPWVQQLLAGVQKQQVYQNINNLLVLTDPLSESEKLLLFYLGHQISLLDKSLDNKKKNYLKMVAKKNGIDSNCLAVIEAKLYGNHETNCELNQQISEQLNFIDFKELDKILSNLETSILVNYKSQILSKNNCKFLDYSLELQSTAIYLKTLIQSSFEELDKAEKLWNNKPYIETLPRQEIWLLLGECIGRYSKLSEQTEAFKVAVFEQGKQSWKELVPKLREILSQEWSTVGDQKNFTEQENKNIDQTYTLKYKNILINCLKTKIKELIINIYTQNLLYIDQDNITAFVNEIKVLSEKTNDSSARQLLINMENLKLGDNFLESLNLELENDNSVYQLITLIETYTDKIIKEVNKVTGWFQMKEKFETGWREICKYQDKLYEVVKNTINLIFEHHLGTALKINEEAIILYEKLLATQERYQQETPEQRQAEKAWIDQQRQRLEQIQKELDIVLS